MHPAADSLLSRGFTFHTARDHARLFPYALYTPPGHDTQRPLPLILFLHGVDECGRDGLKQVGPGLGDALMSDPGRWPMLAILPQKPDAMRPWEMYESPLMRMLDEAERTHAVDTDRIILTGMSQGGAGVWSLGASRPGLWSALVPVCGYGSPREIAPAVRHLPIWAFHGEADPIVPAQTSISMIQAIESLGGTPRLTLYPDVEHDSWTLAFAEPELPAWMLAQQRRS